MDGAIAALFIAQDGSDDGITNSNHIDELQTTWCSTITGVWDQQKDNHIRCHANKTAIIDAMKMLDKAGSQIGNTYVGISNYGIILLLKCHLIGGRKTLKPA